MNVVSLVGRPNGGRLVEEVKRERPRIDLRTLREKFNAFVEATGKWRKTAPEFVSLSLDQM